MRRRVFWIVFLAASCSGPEPNLKSQDPYERYLGVKELAERSDADAVSQVVRALEDPNPLAVLGALEVIADWGRPEFLQHGVPMLKHENADVRQQACITLARLKDPRAIEGLLQALRDAHPGVRREAAKSLAVFGARSEVLQGLLEAVGDKDAGVSYMAHTTLQSLTGRKDVTREKDAWAKALQ